MKSSKKITCKTISFIDLFAGIGGFHSAMKIFSKKNNIQSKCVLVSEIDKEAIYTYSSNFKTKKKNILNIKEWTINNEKTNEIPDHDILFAGFPCQAFSNAGKKRGFLDNVRGTLFFDIAKILEVKKPKFFLLENVKHIVNHNDGETWKTIIDTLKKLNYLIPNEPWILSPHNFGIPQERNRIFIPGIRKDLLEENNNFFKNKSSKTIIDKIKKRKIVVNKFLEKSEKIDKRFFLKETNQKYLIDVLNAWNEFLKKIKKPQGKTLPVIWAFEFWQKTKIVDSMPEWKKKYLRDMHKIYSINKEFIDKWIKDHNVKTWKKRDQKFEWQVGKDENDIKKSFIQLRQSGIRCRKIEKFPTLVAMVQVPIIYDNRKKEWRYLTPRETANLQCFPKNFKTYDDLKNNKKISISEKNRNDFYAYKQFGNAVNVEVVEKILNECLLDKNLWNKL